MGTSQSHAIFLALLELLLSKNLKIKKSTLERFLCECDTIAPWFAVSGNLTVACWDKLGKDLDFAWERGTLKPGVRPVWKLVRSCLEDQGCCKKALEKGQVALEMLQEERSEGKKSKSGTETEWSDTDEELQALIERVERQSLREKRKREEKKLQCREQEDPPGGMPSAPPPYNCMEGGNRGSGRSFRPEVWKAVRTELHLAYPVFQGNRYEEPLDFKVIKSLAKSLEHYPTAVARLAQLGIQQCLQFFGQFQPGSPQIVELQTASTWNTLSANTVKALDMQATISAQLKGGLMIVNQRIDLVQEQVDTLWQIAQIGCQWKMSGLCVTSIQYENFTKAANLSKQLSQYLLGNWSSGFDALMEDLRVAIVNVNSTRVDPSLAKGLTSWFYTAMDRLKEWAGMGALALIFCAASTIFLWCICKMRFAQRRHAAMVVQAFTAIEAGQSPQAWLAVMKDI